MKSYSHTVAISSLVKMTKTSGYTNSTQLNVQFNLNSQPILNLLREFAGSRMIVVSFPLDKTRCSMFGNFTQTQRKSKTLSGNSNTTRFLSLP